MTTLLFVCQANVLRSAAAEALARAMTSTYHPHGPWRFASAGVQALTERTIHPDVAAALAKRGIDASDHQPRQLTAEMLQDADLALTFETYQRAWAVREEPRAFRTILTVRRAAAVIQTPPEERPPRGAHAAVDYLDDLVSDQHRYDEADDFADPIGQGAASIAAAVDEIESLLRVIVPALVTPAAWHRRQAPAAGQE